MTEPAVPLSDYLLLVTRRMAQQADHHPPTVSLPDYLRLAAQRIEQAQSETEVRRLVTLLREAVVSLPPDRRRRVRP